MEHTHRPKRTKIVATIGPSSSSPAVLRELFLAGVNVARLNFSHGTHDQHAQVIADVRRVAQELGIDVALLQDLPGPKVRTGSIGDGKGSVQLVPGSTFTLTTDEIPGTAERMTVNYAGLPHDVEVGRRLFLADGAIALRVVEKSATAIETTVEVGGELRAHQGINYPEGTLAIDAITERDLEHLAFGLDHDVDWVAVSFIRSAADIARAKEFMRAHGKTLPVMAKIEKHEALERIDEIIDAADGIMVARGDLGIEIPLEEVPLAQKDMIARANRAAKPVVTATQMLESMIANPRPTRAEAADVANAILDGSDAVMLSGETARGLYPIEAVRTMATIAREVERRYPHEVLQERRVQGAIRDVATVIAEAAARATQELKLDLIVTGTTTGNTARHIASFRPAARIVALTSVRQVARQLAMVWGVEAIVVQRYRFFETLIEITEELVLSEGFARAGDVVAITSGMPVGEGGTNILKLHTLG